MKKLLFLLLFSIVALAQNNPVSSENTSRISIVSAEQMNVVYRGVPNPISIAVPNVESFSATGIGLENKGNGKFILRPGPGSKTIILIRFKNKEGVLISEKYTFRIKNLPAVSGLINGNNCSKCLVEMSKKEMENAEISTEMKDFLFIDFDSELYKVKSFDVKFSEEKSIPVDGNRISVKAMNEITKLKKGDVIEITNIYNGFDCISCANKKVSTIKVILTD